ncbi:MAG: phosphatase PAP2 family protein [Xenophilus sp.]
MATGWGGVGLIYGLTDRLQRTAQATIPETALDRLIAFHPAGVWMYLSFFALIPCGYLFCDAGRLRWLSRSMQLCALTCGLFYLFWPTTLAYPAMDGDSASMALLRALAHADSSQNCLPSLHGALTLLAIWALLPAPRWRTVLLCAWGLAIAVAVVQTRRHLLLDLSAGLLAGWWSGLAVRAWQQGRLASAAWPLRRRPYPQREARRSIH